MSAANYYHCPVCGLKALYDPSDEVGQEIEVLHRECLAKLRVELEQLRGERDGARARVHFGHSGEYSTCLRRPCIGWVAKDRADALPQAQQGALRDFPAPDVETRVK